MRKIFHVFLFFCAGCAVPAPFSQPQRVSMEGMDPGMVIEEFARSVPRDFKIMNSAVFRYRGRKMTGIGYTAVNRETRVFAVSCMTPMGITLFDLQGTNGNYSASLALKGQWSSEAFAKTAGSDVEAVYMAPAPEKYGRVDCKQYSMTFFQPYREGSLEYVFSGKNAFLSEKRYRRNGSLEWRARYYEYRRIGSKLFPGGIVFENRRYGYSLVLRLKEVFD